MSINIFVLGGRKMCKKLNPLLSLVILCVVFVGILPGKVKADSLGEAKSAIVSLIKEKNFTAADAAIEQMKSDFADEPEDLSWRLYEIAHQYSMAGDRERFDSVCEQIISDFPESPAVVDARTCLARSQIYEFIEQGKFGAAESAIEQMKSDFAGHPNPLSWRLYEIAHKYLEVGNTSRFRSLCEQIGFDFSDFIPADKVRLYLSRFEIEELIEQGDFASADAAIGQMESDFADEPERLSGQLYEIAHHYSHGR